jgi:hypothetical protein
MRTTVLSIGVVLLAALGTGAHGVAQAADQPAKSAKSGKGKSADKGKGEAAGQSDEQISDQLKAFCVKWMGFLETRERDNKKAIKWEKQPSSVSGHYVGYSKEYDCIMKERSSNGTPVATIVYKEYLYEKKGTSQSEAEATEPAIVDATEVTEIFRYTKGQWVY